MPEYEYSRPAYTADVVALHRLFGMVPRVLLIQRKHEPFAGQWALPGGFVNEGETGESAALRELHEETGHNPAHLHDLVGVYDAPGRDPRGWVVSAAYLWRCPLQRPERKTRAGDDAAKAKWFPVDALPLLAFDHLRIVADGLYAAGHLNLSLSLRK